MIRRPDPDPDAPSNFDLEGSTLSPLPGDEAKTDAPEGPADRDERLGEAIEAYLEQAEGGVPPDPETFAAGYPDLGGDLLAALEGLALVKGLVGAPGGPGHRLEEGRRVAGYRIVRELGRGGMGVVYEAVHVGLDRPVALKVLGSQAAPDSSGRRRFLNEARTAAGLHHTHIVPVFDVGQVGGLCYYAMQRIEGTGLDRVLRILRRDRTVASGSTHGSTLKPGRAKVPTTATRPAGDPPGHSVPTLGDETLSWAGGVGPLSEGGTSGARWRLDGSEDEGPVFAPPRGSSYYRWVAEVGRQAAEALAHAHQRGIIHRDIKPSNLLVDARGIIWVADFGLARRLADPSQTQVDSLLGTPRYMSPEQAKTGAIDGRADVYSLGATLYELITLRPPFDGQSAAELIEQITAREPARPRKFDPRVPLDLETILLKALAKRPGDRYAGAAELADDLARFMAHEPVKARRIGPVGRAWRFARRHPGASSVSALAASLVVATATVAYLRILDARNRADAAAKAAITAQKGTEVANEQLRDVVSRLRAADLEGLETQATNISLSTTANRRSKGLDVVRKATERAGQMSPDPARQVRLRDQALAFLTSRDVEARPPINTPDGPRRGLVFGPNGRRIAALTENGELGVWDVAKQGPVDASTQPIAPRRVREIPGERRGGRGGGGIWDLLPDERIAMAGDQFLVIQPDEAGVRWFDVASPDTPTDEFPIKGQRISTVLATSDGKRFLTVGRTVAPPFPTPSGPGSGPDRLESRPKGEEPRICLWDRDHPEAPKATLTLGATRNDASNDRLSLLLAISPDGSRIAAARMFDPDLAPLVSLWDGDGVPLDPIVIQGNATALALGPAGLLAVAGNGGDVAIWDLSLSRPKPLTGLDLHQSFVSLLRFGPRDGSILAAAGGMGGGVELWDLSTHTPIAALPTSERVRDLAFSPDGRTLAAGPGKSIALWSLVEPTAQFVLPESGDTPEALAFGPDDLLVIASRDAPLRLWGGPGQCPPSLVSWPKHRPVSVGFDASGRMIVPEPDAIRWFQPPKDEPVAEVAMPVDALPKGRPEGRGGPTLGSGPGLPFGLPSGQLPLRLVGRSADGKTLLLGSPIRRGNLSLWKATAPNLLSHLKMPDEVGGYNRGPFFALAPDGKTLYHLAKRGDVVFARTIDEKGIRPASWTAPGSEAVLIVLSPDGRTLAVGNHSGEVELRDVADGSTRSRLGVPDGDTASSVDSLAFTPDGQTLAVGGREQVRLWALGASPRPLVRLPGHRGSVRALAFDSKGVRLAGADEKTIKVWDLARLRQELGRLRLDW